jgi:hypothetical protein
MDGWVFVVLGLYAPRIFEKPEKFQGEIKRNAQVYKDQISDAEWMTRTITRQIE